MALATFRQCLASIQAMARLPYGRMPRSTFEDAITVRSVWSRAAGRGHMLACSASLCFSPRPSRPRTLTRVVVIHMDHV